MLKACRAFVLMLILTASTYAGDMQFGVTQPPPPPPPAAPCVGEMQFGAPELIQVALALLGLF